MDNDRAVAVAVEESHPLTAMKVVAQVRLIQEVMQSVMKENTHYGVIPGCQKPSLWKPGAEKLLVTFRIGSEPIVEDLSTSDVARYRVTRKGFSIFTGQVVGSAVGECSSEEEKYKWKGAVCEAEYDATPEDRRRLKYKRDGSTIKQVRTSPADVANTVLKMADKRGYVALALNVTAAGDIFTQDLEDLPAEVAAEIAGASAPAAPIAAPKPKAAPSGDVISEKQANRFYAIGKGAGKSDDEMQAYLQEKYGVSSTKAIPKAVYEEACKWAETPGQGL